jgi:carbamoyltransferase
MKNTKRYYGMHPYGHDSTVCQIDLDQESIFAIALERTTRVKHDSRFSGSILKDFGLPVEDSHFCFPLRELNGSRFTYFEYAHAYTQTIKILSGWKKKKGQKFAKAGLLLKKPIQTLKSVIFFLFSNFLRGKDNLSSFEKAFKKKMGTSRITFSYFDHHTSHAASAYYLAPESFAENTMVVTLDGQGDGYFSKIFFGNRGELIERASSNSVNSLNLFYSLMTGYLGFNPNADEGKLEALAGYSLNTREVNRLYGLLTSVFRVDEHLRIYLEPSEVFPFEEIRGKSSQILDWLETNFTNIPKEDLAFGMQIFYEDFILSYILKARERLNVRSLAVAGGGFANVKLNRRLFESNQFEQFYVCPAMGDDGAALGALILGLREEGLNLDWIRNLEMPFFGPEFDNQEIELALKESNFPISYEAIGGGDYSSLLALDLSKGLICAHFQGSMEFGPRALGNRSILANPLSESVKDDLNLKFKKREWFQPFCPSILIQEKDRLFSSAYNNKHMTCAFTLKDEFVTSLPGITHVDGTARAQFVSMTTNARLFRVLQEFKKLTGFGVLLNTSFNIHGKTIVLTPRDALDDFMSCSIDVLYIGNFRVKRR